MRFFTGAHQIHLFFNKINNLFTKFSLLRNSNKVLVFGNKIQSILAQGIIGRIQIIELVYSFEDFIHTLEKEKSLLITTLILHCGPFQSGLNLLSFRK